MIFFTLMRLLWRKKSTFFSSFHNNHKFSLFSILMGVPAFILNIFWTTHWIFKNESRQIRKLHRSHYFAASSVQRWRHEPIAQHCNRLNRVCHLCLWLEFWCMVLVHTDDWRSVSHWRALASYGFWSRRVAAGFVLVFGAERSAGQGRRPAVDRRRIRPLVGAPPLGRLGRPPLARPLDGRRHRPRPPVSVPSDLLLPAFSDGDHLSQKFVAHSYGRVWKNR